MQFNTLLITRLTVSANPPLWVKQISAVLFCFVNNIVKNVAFVKIVKAESQVELESGCLLIPKGWFAWLCMYISHSCSLYVLQQSWFCQCWLCECGKSVNSAVRWEFLVSRIRKTSHWQTPALCAKPHHSTSLQTIAALSAAIARTFFSELSYL